MTNDRIPEPIRGINKILFCGRCDYKVEFRIFNGDFKRNWRNRNDATRVMDLHIKREHND